MLRDPGFMLVALGFLMAMVGYIYSDKSVSANINQTTTTGYIVVRTNETETTTRTEVKDISNVDYITMDDAVLIAKLVLAEAEGEPEMGKRLVIDTVLNRLDSSDFPNTVYDVVYQPYHYDPAWDGRIDLFSELDDTFKLVVDEIVRIQKFYILEPISFTSLEHLWSRWVITTSQLNNKGDYL